MMKIISKYITPGLMPVISYALITSSNMPNLNMHIEVTKRLIKLFECANMQITWMRFES